jgi:hypothetical protein
MARIVNRYTDNAVAIISDISCYDFVKTLPDQSIS